jgi:hypothetical protein
VITLFAAPKPFRGLVDTLQRNALASWAALGPQVEVLVIGDEVGSEAVVQELGLRSGGPVDRNPRGTPLLSSIFSKAIQMARYEILAYLNADILLTEDFLPAVDNVRRRFDPFLIIGGRWDLDLQHRLEFGPGWSAALRDLARRLGKPHSPEGSDYFVFPRRDLPELPPFALGRSGWDNWMIYRARSLGWPVVDATAAITAVHQNHDYAHLPGGQPHHRLPESEENVRIAGGRRMIFTLRDANWRLDGEGVHPPPRSLRGQLRAIETLPLLRWHSRTLAELAFMLLHPGKAWREWRGRASSAWSRRVRPRTESPP